MGISFGRSGIGALLLIAPLSACGGGSGDGTSSAASAPPAPTGGTTPGTTPGTSPPAAAASLATLAIDGLTISPAFSPDIHDYAMRCAAGTNAVGVTATLAEGVTAALVQPTSAPLIAGQRASATVAENQAVVVEARGSDGSTSEYWLRCLPHDFPAITATRYASTTPGYYLLANSLFSSGAEAPYEIILDSNGTPVWYHGGSAGNLLVPAKNTIAYSTAQGPFGTDPSGHYRILRLDTGAVTTIRAVGTPTDGHELVMLPNGDALLFAYPKSSGFDLSSRGVTTTDIADCAIQEIAPDGSLVWSWLASEHIDPLTESTDLFQAKIGDATVSDVFHCNSIEVTPAGDLIVSARHIDAIFLIARSTGKIVWKLGGVPQNKDGAQILQMEDDPETAFYHQHDARLLASGNITLFDDHQTASGPARGMEIAFDTTAATARVAWQYQGLSNSAAMGSFRRYDDGASVVGWGLLNGTGPALTEVDATGQPLFEIRFDLGDHAYRAVKAAPSSFDIDVLRRTAGQPEDIGIPYPGPALTR